MNKELIINSSPSEVDIALLEDKTLVAMQVLLSVISTWEKSER